jgi:hypothetical protein
MLDPLGRHFSSFPASDSGRIIPKGLFPLTGVRHSGQSKVCRASRYLGSLPQVPTPFIHQCQRTILHIPRPVRWAIAITFSSCSDCFSQAGEGIREAGRSLALT